MSSGETLKGRVGYSRTVNLGNYNSLRVEWVEEFRIGERRHEEVTDDLEARMSAKLKAAGVVR
jgi:hypothetical protein